MEQLNSKGDMKRRSSFDSSSLDEVSEELDRLLIRKLELVQEYLDLTRQNERRLKDGYLNLAKSRYIQGSHSISKIRLPTEESEEYSAVITVTKNSNTKEDTSNSTTDNNSTIKLQISRDMDPSADAKLLRQFGILSSGSVKSAQTGFRSALDLCIDRINVAREISNVQKEFNSLHNIKDKLISKQFQKLNNPEP